MLSSISTEASPTSPSSSDHSLPHRKQRVSAEHTLNRVRENQRRHRARQKDHVASLELRLAETERQLADARAEIEALKAERDTANALACYDITKHFERPDSAIVTGGSTSLSPIDSAPSTALLDRRPSSSISEPTLLATSLQLLVPPLSTTGPPPCCTDSTFTAILSTPSAVLSSTTTTPSGGSDPECSTCKTRPPPSPSESTTLCAQAFVMISQHNVRNLDPELIRLWLNQGYRRAVREGEGCRVENGTLEGLLEYISGV